ncbi:MAG: carbon storage regulator CsrA [Planctomycetia bacterium]|nr:carbon storage regulator CsrA [Planctomycetia bacterium]
MLVLSRQLNESIVIDGGIVVTIVDIRGDRVRLGIEAPPEVAVHRREVQERLLCQSRQRESLSPCASDVPASVGPPSPTDPPAVNPSIGAVR